MSLRCQDALSWSRIARHGNKNSAFRFQVSVTLHTRIGPSNLQYLQALTGAHSHIANGISTIVMQE